MISEDQEIEILFLHEKRSSVQIARKMGISLPVVNTICNLGRMRKYCTRAEIIAASKRGVTFAPVRPIRTPQLMKKAYFCSGCKQMVIFKPCFLCQSRERRNATTTALMANIEDVKLGKHGHNPKKTDNSVVE